jgi:AcrR family transcriptional regulator
MTSVPGDPPDLRSRAKQSIRVEVAEVAWNLFAQRGFDEVTASEVAKAAGISRATFFRYFASKEEAVFAAQEARGDEIATTLSARPVGEDAWTALRHAFDAAIGNYAQDPAEALAKLRLIRETPALRAHQLERQAQWQRMIGGALAARLGTEPLDLRVQALVGAALSALDTAISNWGECAGASDLITLLDQAFEAIEGPHPKLGSPV